MGSMSTSLGIYKDSLFYFNIKPQEKIGQSLEKKELFVFIIKMSIEVLEVFFTKIN